MRRGGRGGDRCAAPPRAGVRRRPRCGGRRRGRPTRRPACRRGGAPRRRRRRPCAGRRGRGCPSGSPAADAASVTTTARSPAAASDRASVSADRWTRSAMRPTNTSRRVRATPASPGSRDVIWRWAFHRWVTIVTPASKATWASAAVASVWPADDHDAVAPEQVDDRRSAPSSSGARVISVTGAPASTSRSRSRHVRGAQPVGVVSAADACGDRNGPSRWTPTARAPGGGSSTTPAATASASA